LLLEPQSTAAHTQSLTTHPCPHVRKSRGLLGKFANSWRRKQDTTRTSAEHPQASANMLPERQPPDSPFWQFRQIPRNSTQEVTTRARIGWRTALNFGMLVLENCTFSSATAAIFPVHSWSQTGFWTGLSLASLQKIRTLSVFWFSAPMVQHDVFCARRPELFW